MTSILPSDDWRTSLRPPSATLLSLVADAYHDAAMAGASMQRAVDSLETFRSQALAPADPFKALDRLDALVGDVVDDPLKPALDSFRERYTDAVGQAAVETVRAAFESGSDAGWQMWLRTFAGTLAGWHSSVATTLVAAEFPFPEAHVADAQRLAGWMAQIRMRRWGEGEPAYRYCIEHAAVTPRERAILHAVVAQISLYHFVDSDGARRAVEQAERECPEEPAVWDTWGEYWMQERDLERARKCYEHAKALDAEGGSGRSGLGDYHLELNDLDAAEECYLEATRLSPNEADGYTALIKLYGREELFEQREVRLAPLAARAAAVAPDGAYDTHLTLSAVYKQNFRYDRAEDTCRTAIDLDSNRVDAYIALGDVYLERDEVERAREAYETAISKGPDFYDGYWSMGMLCERLGEQVEAISWYQASVERRPELLPLGLTMMAPLMAKVERHEEAGRRILDALRDHPENQTLRAALDELARTVYSELSEPEAAVRLYRELLELEGPTAGADVDNSIGELQYWADDYASAADSYRRAIAAREEEPLFHRNLAAALRHRSEWEAARAELARAFALDRDEQKNLAEVVATHNEEGHESFVHGHYLAALECYCRAVEADPDDPVYQSNVVEAWNRLDNPAARLSALDRARTAVEVALAHEATAGDSPLRRLQRAHELAERYGPQILMPAVTLSIAVEFADDLVPRVDPAQQGATFINEELQAMLARIEQRLGVQVPGVRARGNPALAPGTYAILLYEALETKGEAVASQCCALASTEVLTRAGIPVYNVVAGVDAVTREPCSWVSPELTAALDAAGVEWLTDTGVVLRHLESVLERRLALLFGVEDAEFLLQTWEADPERQELVDSVPRDDASRVTFGRLLRALLSERVPVTNAEEILGALRGADLSPAGLPDALRRVRLAVRESLPANADHVRRVRVRVPAEIEELVMTPALRPMDEYRALTKLTALLSNETTVLVTRDPASRHRIRTLLERAGRFEGSVVSEDELVEPARSVVAVE